MLHSKERLGLVRGRSAAARSATGDVLLFLDSHCEVNKGWLEPLLFEITKDSHTVVCPIVDIISPHTFTYKESPIVKGGFTWGMHFTWDSMPSSKLRYESDVFEYVIWVVVLSLKYLIILPFSTLISSEKKSYIDIYEKI